MGRVVGFGGRVLPNSASADKGPKYYNSAETPLFSKSDLLYGIDLARQPASKAGYLAIVEGYTDVMMAHQNGVGQVCATMGTALNARHIKTIRNVASRVVLVFDADAGGEGGVDRALQVFMGSDIDLRVATLPEGLDPCDLLTQRGPEPFQRALESAVEVFEIKLQFVARKHDVESVEGQRRAAHEMLSFVALSPKPDTDIAVLVNRIGQRFHIKEDLLWQRLRELRTARKTADVEHAPLPSEAVAERAEDANSGPAPIHERELVELLLSDPALIAKAIVEVPLEELEHPKVRKVIEAIYRLHASGQPADLDHLREPLDNERLWSQLHLYQENGDRDPDRPGTFKKVAARFRERRIQRRKQALSRKMQEAPDVATRMAILRELNDLNRNENQETGDKDDAA